MTVPVDLIVVNYHTPGDLSAFCESVKSQEFSTLTIVNNDPTPADDEAAQRYAEELGADVITNSENVGYARAVNAAAADLSSDYLAVFNADVEASPWSVQSMCAFMALHPQVGVAGPKQVNGEGRITSAGVTGTNNRPKLRGWKEQDRGQYNDVVVNAVSVSGSAYFVKRQCWDELTNCEVYQRSVVEYAGERPQGPMLPTQLYYEETYTSYHCRAHDWTVAYVGTVEMTHHWARASKNRISPNIVSESRNFFRFACDAHNMKRD